MTVTYTLKKHVNADVVTSLEGTRTLYLAAAGSVTLTNVGEASVRVLVKKVSIVNYMLQAGQSVVVSLESADVELVSFTTYAGRDSVNVTGYNDSEYTIVKTGNWDMSDDQITCKQNNIDSMTAKVYTNSMAYDFATELNTEIIIQRADVVKFEGRVLKFDKAMDADGLFYKTMTCEGSFGYLQDTTVPFVYETSWKSDTLTDVQAFLSYILSCHNNKCEAWKKIELGNVTMNLEGSATLVRGLNRTSCFAAIQEKLVSALGGEMRVRYEGGVHYLDYKPQLGKESSTAVTVAKNMESISEELDPADVVTALIPLGARKGAIISSGNKTSESESDDRITVASVNGGSEIIYDTEALAKYGYIEQCETFDDYDSPADLLSAAQAWLANNNAVVSSITVSALDLSLISNEYEALNMYDMYYVQNDKTGTSALLEIVEQRYSVSDPSSVSSTFGRVGTYQSAGMSSSSSASSSSYGDVPTKSLCKNAMFWDLDDTDSGVGPKHPVPIQFDEDFSAEQSSNPIVSFSRRWIYDNYDRYTYMRAGGYKVDSRACVLVKVRLIIGTQPVDKAASICIYLMKALTSTLPDAEYSQDCTYSKLTLVKQESKTLLSTSLVSVNTAVPVERYSESKGYFKAYDYRQLVLHQVDLVATIQPGEDGNYEIYPFLETTANDGVVVYIVDGMIELELLKTRSDAV